MRLNPDIIFVEKVVNRELLNYFAENAVCVFSGFKKKDISRILKVCNIRKSIKSVWNISKNNP